MAINKRIFVEFLAPPFLAVIWMAIASLIKEGPSFELAVYAFVLIFAYFFSAVPSVLYTFMMEVWFRSGLHARFGLFCTVALSSLLGTGAGILACAIGTWFGHLIGEDPKNFALIGAVVGLLVGLYVGRKQKSTA